MSWPTCREEEENIFHNIFGLSIEAAIWAGGQLLLGIVLSLGAVLYSFVFAVLLGIAGGYIGGPALLISSDCETARYLWIGVSSLTLLVLAVVNPYGLRMAAMIVVAGAVAFDFLFALFLALYSWPVYVFGAGALSTAIQAGWVLFVSYSLAGLMRVRNPLRVEE